MTKRLFGEFSGLVKFPSQSLERDTPLLVAIHGGTYTSTYFNIPGFSLLELAAGSGIPVLAPDRSGYGQSPLLEGSDATLIGQARHLSRALTEAWEQYGEGTSGMVLIGHSIGGAISLAIASEPGDLPILGVAVSGVGLRTPPEHRPMWESLPETAHVDLPSTLKDDVMFGPAGSFDSSMPAASHAADAPAVRAELVDIVSTWHDKVHAVLSGIKVPVHYRQAEFDKLWIVSQSEVDAFAAALAQSPRVDAALVPATGHCMDFHRIGKALQLQQLGFSLQCASSRD